MTNKILKATKFAKVINGTKVMTNAVRLSYANIWEPKAMEDGGDKKYSTAILIPKSDTKTVKAIEAAVKNAIEEGKSKKFGGKVPAKLKTPLRDGDEDYPDDETYKDMYFLNASSKKQPGIVNVMKQPIEDEDEVYSGCYAIVTMNFYAFNVNGNRGIAAGLSNILKVADGERLAGGASAEQDFADLDMSDLLDDVFGEDEDDDLFD